jgi:hypothetical protein
MKHGPLALVDEKLPIIVFATKVRGRRGGDESGHPCRGDREIE